MKFLTIPINLPAKAKILRKMTLLFHFFRMITSKKYFNLII